MSKFVFSGIQPSGVLHLGNYIGAILNWKKMVKNADKDDKFLFMIADLHSLTSCKNPNTLRQNTNELLATYLACGIEPSNNLHFFIQSSIPEHCQLCWLLTTVCPLGQLERMTQFKDKKGKLGADEINAGLLYYPLLMAADILLYRATHVPVGEDQTQHMEFCRDMVDKFENKFGERAKGIFIKPEAIIDKTSKRIMSLGDGTKKMSKSIGDDKDRIMLTDTDDQIAKKIKTAKTDSITGIYFDKDTRPEVSNLINIMSALSGRPVEDISEQYKNSGTKVFKDDLTEIIINEIAPIREKFLDLKNDTNLLKKIVEEGNKYAKKLAEEMMTAVYSD